MRHLLRGPGNVINKVKTYFDLYFQSTSQKQELPMAALKDLAYSKCLKLMSKHIFRGFFLCFSYSDPRIILEDH